MRWWHETVAAVGDLVPGGVPVVGAALLLLTVLGSTLWYFYPEWLPGSRRRRDEDSEAEGRGRRRWWRRPRWPGWRVLGMRWRRRWHRLRLRWRWRLRWRRRRRGAPPQSPALAPDRLPEVPAAALALTADELAAQGRYAEAVRERLRAIVRELVEREVLAYRPGWTVTELAAVGGAAVPGAAAPLTAASEVFSRIWYGHRPAGPADDLAMRGYAEQVRAALLTGPGQPALLTGPGQPALLTGPGEAPPAPEPGGAALPTQVSR